MVVGCSHWVKTNKQFSSIENSWSASPPPPPSGLFSGGVMLIAGCSVANGDLQWDRWSHLNWLQSLIYTVHTVRAWPGASGCDLCYSFIVPTYSAVLHLCSRFTWSEQSPFLFNLRVVIPGALVWRGREAECHCVCVCCSFDKSKKVCACACVLHLADQIAWQLSCFQ